MSYLDNISFDKNGRIEIVHDMPQIGHNGPPPEEELEQSKIDFLNDVIEEEAIHSFLVFGHYMIGKRIGIDTFNNIDEKYPEFRGNAKLLKPVLIDLGIFNWVNETNVSSIKMLWNIYKANGRMYKDAAKSFAKLRKEKKNNKNQDIDIKDKNDISQNDDKNGVQNVN